MKIRWRKRLKVMRTATRAIIFSLIVILLLAGFTVYGARVGTFVINVENDEIKLSLSVREDLSEQTARLTFYGVSALSDTTYGYLPEDVSAGVGDKSAQDNAAYKFMALGFYLINNSEREVDCVMELKVTATVGDPLSILRVLVIEGENGTWSEGNRIFAKPEKSEEDELYLKEGLNRIRYYETLPFISDEKLFSVKIRDLKPSESQKFTLVFWAEGCDIDCTDDRISDKVKMRLDITGY